MSIYARLVMMELFSFNFTVAYDYLTMTNQLNDKEFMTNDLINALYKFLGRKLRIDFIEFVT